MSLPHRESFGAIVATLTCVALASCNPGNSADKSATANKSATAKSPTVVAADEYLRFLAQSSPEQGTSNDLPGTDHSALSDNSEAGVAKVDAHDDSLLIALRAIEPADQDRVLYGTLRDELDRSAGDRVCKLHLWGVASYVNGWQAHLTDLARVQPVGTDTLRALALKRAHAIPRYIDNEIVLLQKGLSESYSSPKVIVREVITQIDGLRTAAPEKSPFSEPTLRDTTPAFRAAYLAIVRDEINPALTRYRDFLQNTYLAAARDALGVSTNPNGKQCYEARLRTFSTLPISADSVYEIGEREIRRIDNELRPLAKRLTGTDDIAKAMRIVTTDPRFMFHSDTEIIAVVQAAQDRARLAMPRAFGTYSDVLVKIQPYPEFRARAGAPGQYQTPPNDGSRPPIHLLNTWDPTHKSRATIENTTFHETWPGHHQQGMVALRMKGQHQLLRVLFNSGYGEGWGLYAERVADELGLYTGDLDRFGYFASQKFRAARMVLDAGIHTRGMNYDQATAFLSQQSTRSPSEVRGEINRYISWPGQAPSYMIGNLEILELRNEAKAQLGDKFDIRAFHDAVLAHGSVTLPQLRDLITEWIGKTATVK